MSDFGLEPIVIHEVVFDDRWVRVTHQNATEATPRSQEIRTTLIDPNLIPGQLATILDELRDALTVAAVERRAPPEQFTRASP